MTTIALLVCIVALAFTVEGALGFGATVVTVTLGAFLVPIETLLPAFVPLNMVLSASIAVRGRRAVDARLLVRRIVPLMLLGMPVGMLAMRVIDGAVLVRVYGVMIVALALLELVAQRPPPSRRLGNLLLFCAGAVQGAFGTGGPLTVFVVGKELPGKHAFRATLSALWVTLNCVLVGGFVLDGRVNATSARTSLWLVLGLAIGSVAGELVHRRLAPEKFRVVVWGMLAIAGTALALR